MDDAPELSVRLRLPYSGVIQGLIYSKDEDDGVSYESSSRTERISVSASSHGADTVSDVGTARPATPQVGVAHTLPLGSI